jgi:hypothetical protein
MLDAGEVYRSRYESSPSLGHRLEGIEPSRPNPEQLVADDFARLVVMVNDSAVWCNLRPDWPREWPNPHVGGINLGVITRFHGAIVGS